MSEYFATHPGRVIWLIEIGAFLILLLCVGGFLWLYRWDSQRRSAVRPGASRLPSSAFPGGTWQPPSKYLRRRAFTWLAWGSYAAILGSLGLMFAAMKMVPPAKSVALPAGLLGGAVLVSVIGLMLVMVNVWRTRGWGKSMVLSLTASLVMVAVLLILLHRVTLGYFVKMVAPATVASVPATKRALASYRPRQTAFAATGGAIEAPQLNLWEARARELLGTGATLAPQSNREWFKLGFEHGANQEWPEAIECFIAAIKIDPTKKDSWAYLASCYVEEHAFTAGEIKLKELLAAYPASAYGWYALGLVQADGGTPTAAIEALKKATEMNPSFAEGWNKLATTYLALGQFNKAEEVLKKALDLDPNSARAWCNMGFVYYHAGSRPEAIAAYRKALKSQPKFQLALVNLALAQHESGDDDGARKTCDDLATFNSPAATGLRKQLFGSK